MGLYLLNISIDPADPNPEYIPEDLSFNDQESVIELIVEQVLGYENAIKEYDDHDTEEHNKKKNIKIDLLAYQTKPNKYIHHLLSEKKNPYPDHEARLTNGYKEIASPPPKV